MEVGVGKGGGGGRETEKQWVGGRKGEKERREREMMGGGLRMERGFNRLSCNASQAINLW